MTTERAPETMYAPMPELGTMRECVFCHFMVTLEQTRTGWHHWVAARDALDGRWHCDGGKPGYRHMPALHTLHIPVPPTTGAPFAARYDVDGLPHHPQA